MESTQRSVNSSWFARALARIPGGVNSPVRAFGAVGGEPFFVARAFGSRIVDTDGREYLDYVQSWGASILGHAHPKVVEAVQRAAADGTSYGAPTPREVELVEAICARVPSVEKARLVSSGTEAAMTAVRLARGATGRDKIVKFAGCYHGHLDALLVQAGSGVATLGLAGSAGVTPGTVADTIVVPYNDIGALDSVLSEHGAQTAAILVEPIAANMGLVVPGDGFLAALRDRATRSGALLVFDEVITGFRVGLGGAQARYGITPDLSIFGKVIGGDSRSPRWAVVPRLWTSSRRAAPCTKPAPFPETRSRPPPGSQSSPSSTTRRTRSSSVAPSGSRTGCARPSPTRASRPR